MGTKRPTNGAVGSNASALPRLAIAIVVVSALLTLLTAGAVSQDLCAISYFSGTPGSQEVVPTPGDQVAVYFDFSECSCSYPHVVQSVSFSLTGVDAQWPVTVDVVVYDRHATVRHPCAGPGAELLRQTVVCDEATFGYPNVGTVDIAGAGCLTGPIFVAIEFAEGNTTPMPQFVFDDDPAPETCKLWYFEAADFAWKEWSREFGDTRPGYPLLNLTVTPYDSTCAILCSWYGDADGNTAWSLGDLVYMVNWQSGGGATPAPGADVTCDGLINGDDYALMSAFVTCPPEPCYPSHPGCTTPEPFAYRYLVDAGDANGDDQYSIADAVHIVNYIFGGGPKSDPFPVACSDADGDCQATIADAVYLINFIFGGGPAPVGKTNDWPYQCGGLY